MLFADLVFILYSVISYCLSLHLLFVLALQIRMFQNTFFLVLSFNSKSMTNSNFTCYIFP